MINSKVLKKKMCILALFKDTNCVALHHTAGTSYVFLIIFNQYCHQQDIFMYGI